MHCYYAMNGLSINNFGRVRPCCVAKTFKSISGAPGAGMYDPSMGMLSPAEAQIYDFKQSEYYNPYKTGGGDWQEYLRQMRGN